MAAIALMEQLGQKEYEDCESESWTTSQAS